MYKKLSFLILLTVCCLSIGNNCKAAVGYVVFGNPPSCSSTGICNSSSVNGMYQGTTRTPVTFTTINNAENTHCTLTMTINMTALSTNQPMQFNMFKTGQYVFVNSAKIYGVVLGGEYFDQHPEYYVVIPANLSVSVPMAAPQNSEGPVFTTINLGTLPIKK